MLPEARRLKSAARGTDALPAPPAFPSSRRFRTPEPAPTQDDRKDDAMVSNYRPEFREVFAQCWADGTWLPGGVCLPTRRGLLEHLNQKEPFLKLRNVALSDKKEPLPFLALRRDSVSLVVADYESVPAPKEASAQHRVVCLLRGAILRGTLETLASLRVSDYLMRNPGFFALHDCTLRMASMPSFPTPIPVVLVNGDRVIGVAEET